MIPTIDLMALPILRDAYYHAIWIYHVDGVTIAHLLYQTTDGWILEMRGSHPDCETAQFRRPELPEDERDAALEVEHNSAKQVCRQLGIPLHGPVKLALCCRGQDVQPLLQAFIQAKMQPGGMA